MGNCTGTVLLYLDVLVEGFNSSSSLNICKCKQIYLCLAQQLAMWHSEAAREHEGTLKSMSELCYKGEERGPVDHISNEDTTDEDTNILTEKQKADLPEHEDNDTE